MSTTFLVVAIGLHWAALGVAQLTINMLKKRNARYWSALVESSTAHARCEMALQRARIELQMFNAQRTPPGRTHVGVRLVVLDESAGDTPQ